MRPERRIKPEMDGALTAVSVFSPLHHLRTSKILSKRWGPPHIIECKRYRPDRKVGLSIVQRLYGIKTSYGATKAFLVTSSSFTRDALKFAKQHLWELDLKDHSDLLNWLTLHWKS